LIATNAELYAMLSDARTVWHSVDPDETHKNTIKFAENVKFLKELKLKSMKQGLFS
jgi:hypothetical protein